MNNKNNNTINLNQVAESVKNLVTGLRKVPEVRILSAAEVWNIQRQFRGMRARRTQW